MFLCTLDTTLRYSFWSNLRHSAALSSWRLAPVTQCPDVVAQDFLATFGRLFDRVPVRILTSDFHHQTLQKKPTRSEIMIVECSFPSIFFCCEVESVTLLVQSMKKLVFTDMVVWRAGLVLPPSCADDSKDNSIQRHHFSYKLCFSEKMLAKTVRITKTLDSWWWNIQFDGHNRTLVYFS